MCELSAKYRYFLSGVLACYSPGRRTEDAATRYHMAILQPGRPPGWDQPKLTGFFETLWANTVATFARKTEAHRLCRIDELMFEVASDWKGGSPTAETIVSLLMYFRAHSAFRCACALGMGGATVEGMGALRQSFGICWVRCAGAF